MLGLASRKGTHGACQPMKGLPSPIRGALEQFGRESLRTELLTPGVERLGQSVRVQKEQVSRPESEQEIQKALYTLCKGRTTIAIAHRLSTLKNRKSVQNLSKTPPLSIPTAIPLGLRRSTATSPALYR